LQLTAWHSKIPNHHHQQDGSQKPPETGLGQGMLSEPSRQHSPPSPKAQRTRFLYLRKRATLSWNCESRMLLSRMAWKKTTGLGRAGPESFGLARPGAGTALGEIKPGFRFMAVGRTSAFCRLCCPSLLARLPEHRTNKHWSLTCNVARVKLPLLPLRLQVT